MPLAHMFALDTYICCDFDILRFRDFVTLIPILLSIPFARYFIGNPPT